VSADIVRSLVIQLGAPTFAQREHAQRALIDLGPSVVAIIENLPPSNDPEVNARLQYVRSVLVGNLNYLRTYIANADTPDGESNPPIPPLLRRAVAGSQPRTGDYMLSLVAAPDDKQRRIATNVFVQTWDSMSPAQLERYLQLAMEAYVDGRPQYPEGVSAAIQMGYRVRYGWFGWAEGSANQNLSFQTTTVHYVDRKPYKKPFKYPGPGATTGWVQTAEFPIGKHEVRLETNYTYSKGALTFQGLIVSPHFQFEIIPRDSPDLLLAPSTPELDAQVQAAVTFAETRNFDRPAFNRELSPLPEIDPWQPQIRWRSVNGESGSLHVPTWRVKPALPVDLCFDVDLRVEETGQTYPCGSIVVLQGDERTGFPHPKNVRQICQEQSGFVNIRVLLRPSRAAALTEPKVTKYYGRPIESPVMRMKVN
jgi:hypothetical protein